MLFWRLHPPVLVVGLNLPTGHPPRLLHERNLRDLPRLDPVRRPVTNNLNISPPDPLTIDHLHHLDSLERSLLVCLMNTFHLLHQQTPVRGEELSPPENSLTRIRPLVADYRITHAHRPRNNPQERLVPMAHSEILSEEALPVLVLPLNHDNRHLLLIPACPTTAGRTPTGAGPTPEHLTPSGLNILDLVHRPTMTINKAPITTGTGVIFRDDPNGPHPGSRLDDRPAVECPSHKKVPNRGEMLLKWRL